jgi:hypothetical protein
MNFFAHVWVGDVLLDNHVDNLLHPGRVVIVVKVRPELGYVQAADEMRPYVVNTAFFPNPSLSEDSEIVLKKIPKE